MNRERENHHRRVVSKSIIRTEAATGVYLSRLCDVYVYFYEYLRASRDEANGILFKSVPEFIRMRRRRTSEGGHNETVEFIVNFHILK